MNVADIHRQAEGAEREVAEIASRLVTFNSAHPAGRTDECVDYIQSYLDRYGIAHEVHANDPHKPNLVARLEGASDKTILWVGHLDVVPEGEPEFWTYPAYSGTIAGGFVYGRGSSDMKGACAAAMVAARILRQLDEPLPHTVEFWFTADEEIGGRDGVRWLVESGRLKGDVCLIGDGSGGGMHMPSLDLGCKGAIGVKLIARGQTAHGSTPFMGDNALKKLIAAIPVVEQIAAFPLDVPDELREVIRDSVALFKASEALSPEQQAAADRLFDYPTVTCNILHAGIADNVVPDAAEATFDVRLTPGSDPLRVKAQLEQLVRGANLPGVEIEVRAGPTAGYYVSSHSPVVHQLAQAIELATGKQPAFKILTGGTDGIPISRILGIPAIGYGTSLEGQAHQPDERVSIENLILGIKVYATWPLALEFSQ